MTVIGLFKMSVLQIYMERFKHANLKQKPGEKTYPRVFKV